LTGYFGLAASLIIAAHPVTGNLEFTGVCMMKTGKQKIQDQFSLSNTPWFLSMLVVVLGIVLRLRQYFANRSLWVDEASLALNIINRSFGGLTQPLDYNQGAPVGFLFIEKL